jgi:hypothetical protein
MPRDSNGIMTLPPTNPVVPDTIISVNWANPTLEDIADEITNSLPRSGSAPMVGSLAGPDGSAATPAFTFSAGTGTGMYRDTTDESKKALGFSQGGAVKLLLYGAMSVMAKLLKVPGIMADVGISIYVDPDTGTAAPDDPLAGEPFVDLNYAMDWLVKFRQSHQAKTTIWITAGKTVQYNASRVIRYNVVIRSTGPGVATINGNNTTLTFMSASDSDITDISFTNLRLIADGCNVGINNSAGNQATSDAIILHAVNGGGFTSDSFATQPRGSILLENGFFNVTTGNVTLSNGMITVERSSNLSIVGNLALPAGSLFVSTGSSAYIVGDFSSTNATLQGVNAVENSVVKIDGHVTVNVTAVSNGVGASGNSYMRLGSGISNVSVTAAAAFAVMAQRGAIVHFSGSGGSLALSGQTAVIQAQTRGACQINGGKTPFTIPGVSKAFNAVSGAYILMGSTPTSGTPVYTPALNAASGNPATGSYITT